MATNSQLRFSVLSPLGVIKDFFPWNGESFWSEIGIFLLHSISSNCDETKLPLQEPSSPLVGNIGTMLAKCQKWWQNIGKFNWQPQKCSADFTGVRLICVAIYECRIYQGTPDKKISTIYFLVPVWAPLVNRSTVHSWKNMNALEIRFSCPKGRHFFTYFWHVRYMSNMLFWVDPSMDTPTLDFQWSCWVDFLALFSVMEWKQIDLWVACGRFKTKAVWGQLKQFSQQLLLSVIKSLVKFILIICPCQAHYLESCLLESTCVIGG